MSARRRKDTFDFFMERGRGAAHLWKDLTKKRGGTSFFVKVLWLLDPGRRWAPTYGQGSDIGLD